jgi:UDP-N-acetylmuramoylalanine--D-glutamate ligase
MLLADLSGRRVAIWGLGREGLAAARVLEQAGIDQVVLVDDQGLAADFELPLGWTVAGGADTGPALTKSDVVIKSPGISRHDPRVAEIERAGGIVTGSSALWMAGHSDRTIGVTGSKGKSTTTALIHWLLEQLGVPNLLGGNIGIPVLELPDAPLYVMELSSYQSSELDTSPRIVVLTSLFPEHLDWHRSEGQYYADKLNIVRHSPDVVIYNARDARLSALLPAHWTGRSVAVGTDDGFHLHSRDDSPGSDVFAYRNEPLADRSTVQLLGAHNAINVCLALAAISEYGIDCIARRADVATALSSFVALPHRLNVITDPSGLVFVDDSLSTAPDSAIAALDAIGDGPVCLLVGGQDRGLDYSVLKDALRTQNRPVTVIGLPESGARIVAELDDLPNIDCELAPDLLVAVQRARATLTAQSAPGSGLVGTVLLSPAAPSYGIYRDSAARSTAFRAAIDATRD